MVGSNKEQYFISSTIFFVTAASPTSIVWWDTMDQKHICITGSEVDIAAAYCIFFPS